MNFIRRLIEEIFIFQIFEIWCAKFQHAISKITPAARQKNTGTWGVMCTNRGWDPSWLVEFDES